MNRGLHEAAASAGVGRTYARGSTCGAARPFTLEIYVTLVIGFVSRHLHCMHDYYVRSCLQAVEVRREMYNLVR